MSRVLTIRYTNVNFHLIRLEKYLAVYFTVRLEFSQWEYKNDTRNLLCANLASYKHLLRFPRKITSVKSGEKFEFEYGMGKSNR